MTRHGSRYAGLAAVLAVLLLMPATAGGQGARVHVGENVRAGTDADPLRGRDAPAVAVNPADPRHIVLIDEDFIAGQCDYHVTFDGGRTWTDGHLQAPPDFANPPCRTFDSGGYAHFNQSVAFGTGQNVYVTFASHRGPQQRPESRIIQGEGDSILVARSTDGGRTFSPAVVAIQGSPESQPYYIRPGLGVEPRPDGDRIYISAWGVIVTSGGAGGGGGDRRLVTTVSHDGGLTWAPPVDAQAPGEAVREPTEPVVGSDGAVYVGWRNRDPAPAPNHIIVAKSVDQGATWARSQAGEVTGPGISNNGGFPRLAIDKRTNALYLVYQGLNFGDLDIIFQRSTDGGQTWSPPTRVNDDARGNGAAQVAPHISVAPNGRIDLVWFDRRGGYTFTGLDPDSRGQGDIYYTSSSDGGLTFSANRRVTDRALNLDVGLNARVGSYIWYGPELAPIGDDRVLIVWPDGRLGSVDTETQDIFMATVDLAAAGPAAVEHLARPSPVNFSVLLSQLAYPGGSERVGRNDPSKLVIVNEDDVPAALIGASLARAVFGPLLLSPKGGLTKELREEVDRVGPAGVYLIGDEERLSAKVENDVKAAGVGNVVRLTGPTPAETARAAADVFDLRTAEAKAKGEVAAINTAVVVNPESDDASAGVALAAALRAPVLFSGRDAVPTATTDAIQALKAKATLVVGGTGSVGDSVLAQLPAAKRLGGGDAAATNAAVAREWKDRNLAVNQVYVSDLSRPMDQAVVAAAVSRIGALPLATPGASPDQAEPILAALQLTPTVDRIFVARSRSASGANPLLIGASIVLAVAGIVLLLLALDRRRKAAVPEPTAPDAAPVAR
ncbi:MAG: cell wall-binding repeat-containing protein [Actinomycetota bacterium]|nr:cell wall-binding repeat-containing protein [Actinomycetota bacterium]